MRARRPTSGGTLRPAIPNREIAERLGVTVRTVQRAKETLERVGIVPARAGRYSAYEGPHGRENLADVYMVDRRQLPALGGRHLELVEAPSVVEQFVDASATPESRGGDNGDAPHEDVKQPPLDQRPSGLDREEVGRAPARFAPPPSAAAVSSEPPARSGEEPESPPALIGPEIAGLPPTQLDAAVRALSQWWFRRRLRRAGFDGGTPGEPSLELLDAGERWLVSAGFSLLVAAAARRRLERELSPEQLDLGGGS